MRFILILSYFFFNFAFCHDYEKNGISILHPIIKMSSENSKIGAGYFKIQNNTKNKIVLNSISSNIAERQEIHEIILINDVYKMRPIKKGLSILPYKEIEFKPKSHHIMFYNIKQMHLEGDFISAKLSFNNDLEIPIDFKVVMDNKHKHH